MVRRFNCTPIRAAHLSLSRQSSGRRSGRERQNLFWKKKELNQKRASIKEQIDALAEEWRKLQGLSTTTQIPIETQPMLASSGVSDAPPADEAAVPVMNAVDGSPRPSTPVAVISQIKDVEEVEGMLRPRSPALSDKYQIRQGVEPPSHSPFSIHSDPEPVMDPPNHRVLRQKPLSVSSAMTSKQISVESPPPRAFIPGSPKSSPEIEKLNSRASDRRPRPGRSATTPEMTAQGSTSTRTSERRLLRTTPIYVQDDDDDVGEAAATSSKQQGGREVETRENDIIIPETEDETEGVDYDIVPPYKANKVFSSAFRRASNVRPSASSFSGDKVHITSVSGKQDLPAKKTAIEGPSARLRG
ncbi:hypothetical protein BS47DRAFT_1070990 [Hydnum rufescens UP504]|uniref:Uncharacterized protein n=1 Tax=Hydnum rufescens UP504 TaxID=1448309 RepID=A0A9P6E1J5_9AGAM|nr:hypothetical protein BS47DRAFT_1070990 [Hydnum rufescens UP504]